MDKSVCAPCTGNIKETWSFPFGFNIKQSKYGSLRFFSILKTSEFPCLEKGDFSYFQLLSLQKNSFLKPVHIICFLTMNVQILLKIVIISVVEIRFFET